MAYQKSQELYVLKQDIGFIEIEFLEHKESPVVEKPKSHVYKLSAPISRKSLRADRKMRQKSFIKYDLPASTFSVAQSRISR